MLFSDIEGSTVLLSRLGTRYGEALSAQRDVLRSAISDWRGHEMGTEGDSFFVVFESAADAVACCAAAQHALGGHAWPGGATVRVRMGLHSGEPIRHEDGYIGMDVHRAARIAATAHGGQVVMSDVTWELAHSALPAGLSARDLGLHRLKDIDGPEHIYQLAGPGLPEHFPPLKSLGAATNLPVPITPLVGRNSDREQLCRLIPVGGEVAGDGLPHHVGIADGCQGTEVDPLREALAERRGGVDGQPCLTYPAGPGERHQPHPRLAYEPA